jgi:signal transduction histidine kinase
VSAATTTLANVLVVDDDARSLMAMRELLQAPGQCVVTAQSGSEALRSLQQTDYAVILLDARMPVMDGFETARLIRDDERSRHTPIIFLTGAYEDPPSMFRGYEAGAVDYIVKPPVPEILKSKISVFVDLYNKNAVLTREIAERSRIENVLRASEENLRALAARLQSVQEEEQRRIAREIHDELGQALTGLKMDLTWVASRLPRNARALAQKTKAMSGLIDGMVQSVRELASRLRPEVLDELGLAAAIKWQAREFQMRAGVRCMVDASAENLALDQDRSTAVFRVFQELLTNVARHAAATKVDVALRQLNGSVVLEVRDNGRGIGDAQIRDPASLGLLGMRERIVPFDGRFEIGAGTGKGTVAVVSIPAEHAPERNASKEKTP